MIGRMKKRPRYGRGIGSFISNMFNSLKPKLFGLAQSAIHSNAMKKIVNNAKDVALHTGSQILDDISSGQNVKESLKKNVKKGANQIINDSTKTSTNALKSLLEENMSKPVSKKKSPMKRPKAMKKVVASKRKKIGIFSL